MPLRFFLIHGIDGTIDQKPEARLKRNVYHLYAKEDGAWLGNIYAETYEQAHQQALAQLEPRYYDKPIRVDYDADAPSNRPTETAQ